MERTEALTLLLVGSSSERLDAARFFEANATREDEGLLREARAREVDSYTRRALEGAISRASRQDQPSGEPRPTQDEHMSEAVSRAQRETAERLIHELRPIVGALRLAAQREIEPFEPSRTAHHLQRLQAMLAAIESLATAATPASLEEFELASYLRAITRAEEFSSHTINLIGPEPLVALADPVLLGISVVNGLRNAIDASTSVGENGRVPPVVLTWGQTDKEVWISILDHGPGIKSVGDRHFAPGTTSKQGHLGMGLALAERAAESLRGRISLRNQRGGGCRFELRWPRGLT